MEDVIKQLNTLNSNHMIVEQILDKILETRKLYLYIFTKFEEFLYKIPSQAAKRLPKYDYYKQENIQMNLSVSIK